MAQRPVRIGVVGAGSFAQQVHIPNFQKISGVEVVAVCNRTPATAQRVAQQFGVPRAVTDWREVLAMPNVDAVLVGTWPNMHAPVTIAALEAGKHVLCLGRMALDLQEAQAMHRAAEAARARGLRTMLVPPAFGVRAHPFMRQLLAQGYVGQVRQVMVYRMTGQLADTAAPLMWRQDRDISGVNVLLIGADYEIVRGWFGEVTRVLASEHTFTPERPTSDGSGRRVKVEIPDAITVLAELRQGGTVTFLESGVARFGGAPRVEVYGSEGTLVYAFGREEIAGAKVGEAELKPLPTPPELERQWQVEADFVRMVREGIPDVWPTFAHGVKYMEFTEAARRSAKQGQWVALPLSEAS